MFTPFILWSNNIFTHGQSVRKMDFVKDYELEKSATTLMEKNTQACIHRLCW